MIFSSPTKERATECKQRVSWKKLKMKRRKKKMRKSSKEETNDKYVRVLPQNYLKLIKLKISLKSCLASHIPVELQVNDKPQMASHCDSAGLHGGKFQTSVKNSVFKKKF